MVSIIFAIFEFKFSELLWGWVLVNPVQPVVSTGSTSAHCQPSLCKRLTIVALFVIDSDIERFEDVTL